MKIEFKYAFFILLIILLYSVHIPTTYACKPVLIPEDYAALINKSAAIAYGEIINLSNNGREATLKVSSYVGPGNSPSEIKLPKTKSSQSWKEYFSLCKAPDVSTQFQETKKYVVFMKKASPNNIELTLPKGPTAIWVENDNMMFTYVNLINFEGIGLSVRENLEFFATEKGMEIQKPTGLAKVWSNNNFSSIVYFIIFLLLLLGFWWRRRYKLSNPRH